MRLGRTVNQAHGGSESCHH